MIWRTFGHEQEVSAVRWGGSPVVLSFPSRQLMQVHVLRVGKLVRPRQQEGQLAGALRELLPQILPSLPDSCNRMGDRRTESCLPSIQDPAHI